MATATPPTVTVAAAGAGLTATTAAGAATYRDADHGYAVAVPAGFTVRDDLLKDGHLSLVSEPVGEPMMMSDQAIWIEVESKPRNGRTLRQWLAEEPMVTGRVITGVRDLTVDGARARRQTEDDMAAIDIDTGHAVETYVEGPEWLYKIEAITNNPAAFQRNEATYDAVVSSFDVLNN
jgi:hypothetical protein